MFCKNCGREQQIGERFCANCGTEYDSPSNIQQTTPTSSKQPSVQNTQHTNFVQKITAKCPICGTLISGDDQSCPNCKRQLYYKCPTCKQDFTYGQLNYANGKCPHCGARITELFNIPNYLYPYFEKSTPKETSNSSSSSGFGKFMSILFAALIGFGVWYFLGGTVSKSIDSLSSSSKNGSQTEVVDNATDTEETSSSTSSEGSSSNSNKYTQKQLDETKRLCEEWEQTESSLKTAMGEFDYNYKRGFQVVQPFLDMQYYVNELGKIADELSSVSSDIGEPFQMKVQQYKEGLEYCKQHSGYYH